MSNAMPEEKNDRAGAEDAPARGRGRPRSAEAEQAILDATLRMLGTQGVTGTTIEGVAADAGVGKTTIYRRWPTKTDLILAAISNIVPPGDPQLHKDFVDRVVNPFRGMLRLFIERGIERGELRPDLEVEPLVDLLHAIPIYRILMSRGDPAALEQVPGAYLPILAHGILNSSVKSN